VILGYKLLRAGKSSPALRPLVTDAERWARDSAELAETSEVSKTFTAGDWAVQLDLYSGGDDPEPPTQQSAWPKCVETTAGCGFCWGDWSRMLLPWLPCTLLKRELPI